ncbi:MAG: NAD(P)H-dependent oxidoreductase [Spirochaetales bacterium]|nr:NAD(P)H-dependent oxidoreductase [Spirochaetales bacterium]
MKILLINGSPRGEKSNTLKLARSFCTGLSGEVTQVNLKDKSIKHCLGCFACWSKSPGKCIIKDDMADLLEIYFQADLIVWSFPLYYFGMPSLAKAFMDRLLPLNDPHLIAHPDGTVSHPSRYDLSGQKHVLISTCGFSSREKNFEALVKQFEIFSDHEESTELVKILCPEGELFAEKALNGRTEPYLNHVTQAGREFALSGKISDKTEAALEELLFPQDQFLEMANAHWDLLEAPAPDSSKGDDGENQAKQFLRQMAACYNPAGLPPNQEGLVLEMAFSQPDCTFQLVGDKEKCRLEKGSPRAVTIRIETPFPVWREISEGKLNGAQAMMDGLYKVKGDFDVMNSLDVLFGGKSLPTPQTSGKRRNMNLLLLPWIALWVLLPISSRPAGIAALVLCALTNLAGFRYRLTLWDRITQAAVTLLGGAALLGYEGNHLIGLSYFLFGLMWFLSSRTGLPLTASYTSEKFGGPSAYDNPLFMKTNRIITDGWGILYLLLAPISLILLTTPLKSFAGLILQAGPIGMGLFTAWFQKWYPARVARGV